MSAELDAVINAASVIEEKSAVVTVTLEMGTVVSIRKCKVKDTSSALRLMKVLFDTVGIKRLSDVATLDLENIDTILQLIANAQEPLFAIAADLSGMTEAEFDELEIDDAIRIILKAFEVNKRFFLDRVLPLVQSALQKG